MNESVKLRNSNMLHAWKDRNASLVAAFSEWFLDHSEDRIYSPADIEREFIRWIGRKKTDAGGRKKKLTLNKGTRKDDHSKPPYPLINTQMRDQLQAEMDRAVRGK